MDEKKSMFTFQHLDKKKFSTLSEKDNQEFFMKWSMKGRINAQMFSFDQSFQLYQKEDFVKDFFKDAVVMSSLKVVSDKGCGWSPLGQTASSVTVEIVPCSVLSMAYFDRLYDDAKVARENGNLVRCFDERYDDFTISDELRKMLLIDDSDHYCLYSESDREEFLFLLFQHFCLGGEICQYEEKITPYLDITKQLYKDLISVQKKAETKDIGIVSHVFKVTASDDKGEVFYPSDKEHVQTFSYLIVDPIKRHVTVLYHKFGMGEVE